MTDKELEIHTKKKELLRMLGDIHKEIVFGDLENEGDIAKQIDWNTLPQNVEKVKEYIPEISMMFVYAHPEKLDLVKEKLNPVLGEKKLIVSPKQNTDKAIQRFVHALDR